MLLYSIQCLHFLYFPFYINGSLGSGNSLPLFLWSFILFYLPFTPYRAPVHWVLELLGRSSLFFSHASFCCHFLIFWKKICHLIFNFKELPSFLPPLYNTMLVTWMHPLSLRILFWSLHCPLFPTFLFPPGCFGWRWLVPTHVYFAIHGDVMSLLFVINVCEVLVLLFLCSVSVLLCFFSFTPSLVTQARN